MRWPAALASIVLLGASGGPACGKRGADKVACADMFKPPPDVMALCVEHTSLPNGGGFYWRSYGTNVPRHQVMAPYLNAAGECGYGFFSKPPLLQVSHGSTSIEAFERGDDGHPTCGKARAAAFATEIVIKSDESLP